MQAKFRDMQKLLIILSLLLAFTQKTSATEKYEIRAAWITTIGGLDWPASKATSAYGIKRQKDELCRQLDMLKEANFNTVLFQTRLRGDVVYPSLYETFAESLAGETGRNPGYDPLKFAIEECHKRGLELHAWIVCIPIGNDRQVKLLGKNSVVKKNPDMCIHFKKAWYLDPGNPNTAGYLSAIAKEITTCYDIDGIHLDYIRFGGTAYKHNPSAEITAVGAVTEFCRQIREAMDARGENIILSAAMMAEDNAAYYYGQNAAQMGRYIHILMPMIYRYQEGGVSYSTDWCMKMVRLFTTVTDAQVWAGTQTYSYVGNNVSGLDEERLRSDCEDFVGSGASGIVLFRYALGTFPDVNDLWESE